MPTLIQGRKATRAFTLVEILIVVAMFSVVAATVLPQYKSTTNDAKYNATVFNLQEMRAQIERYRAQHDDAPPATLDALTVSTDIHGQPGHDFGPYMTQIRRDAINDSDAVEISPSSPIHVQGDAGGWIYDPVRGELRINHNRYSSL